MPAINPLTIKFHTLGCKVNQYDTQSIRERFLEQGFKEIRGRARQADFYLINTCTVTASADQKSRGIIRRAIKENPKAKIIVTGCLTELDEDQIAAIDPKILIIKNKDKHRIYELSISCHCEEGEARRSNPVFEIASLPLVARNDRNTARGISFFEGHTRAFLKIQDGCDNFCSYCKVPLVRGRSKSKPLNEVVREAKRLAKKGFKEIVLTGICLGSYGRDHPRHSEPRLWRGEESHQPKDSSSKDLSLVRVINELEKIKGLSRIRLSSIEPQDVTDALINKIAKSPKLCRHLHIPIQSGDDQILKKMRRRYTRGFYLKLIKKIRNKIPDAAITTDCLIGFPGELPRHFKNTLDLVKRIFPLKVHIFPYSAREGTAAYLEPYLRPLSATEIKHRIAGLKRVANSCSKNYRERFLGRKMPVLFEAGSKEKKGYWEGYTDNYIKVCFKSRRILKNKLLCVKLKRIIGDYVLAV